MSQRRTDIDLVLVDFDDTLVETAPRFFNSRRALFDLLHRSGFDRARAERVHHERVEPGMLRQYGFGPFRLEHSFRATYLSLCEECGRDARQDLEEACAALGRAVAGTPPGIAGAIEALERLSAALPTVIYTQAGDAAYQLRCLHESGVLETVGEERIWITPHKTAAAFREALERFGITDPRRAWMIGNSIRSDINPALEAGANAILVEVDTGWEYDDVPPIHDAFLRAASFAEAARILLESEAPE